MKQNVGGIDRSVRAILGLAIIAAGFYFKSWWGAIGLVPLLTAALGWCPAYAPFGLTTCAVRRGGQTA
jgi:ribose/xylose/arabinose/galactoside ABC-type transport system permease subunit